MDAAKLTQRLKERAAELGFSLCGVCPAVTPPGLARFDEWLARGYAGQMRYLADRRDAYQQPTSILIGARSIVMLAMDYRTAEPAEPAATQGRISRYAESVASSQTIRRPFEAARCVGSWWFGHVFAFAPHVACPKQSAR